MFKVYGAMNTIYLNERSFHPIILILSRKSDDGDVVSWWDRPEKTRTVRERGRDQDGAGDRGADGGGPGFTQLPGASPVPGNEGCHNRRSKRNRGHPRVT